MGTQSRVSWLQTFLRTSWLRTSWSARCCGVLHFISGTRAPGWLGSMSHGPPSFLRGSSSWHGSLTTCHPSSFPLRASPAGKAFRRPEHTGLGLYLLEQVHNLSLHLPRAALLLDERGDQVEPVGGDCAQHRCGLPSALPRVRLLLRAVAPLFAPAPVLCSHPQAPPTKPRPRAATSTRSTCTRSNSSLASICISPPSSSWAI